MDGPATRQNRQSKRSAGEEGTPLVGLIFVAHKSSWVGSKIRPFTKFSSHTRAFASVTSFFEPSWNSKGKKVTFKWETPRSGVFKPTWPSVTKSAQEELPSKCLMSQVQWSNLEAMARLIVEIWHKTSKQWRSARTSAPELPKDNHLEGKLTYPAHWARTQGWGFKSKSTSPGSDSEMLYWCSFIM